MPVAILGSDTLDVAEVDVTTLVFGPGDATPVHETGGHVRDVNRDGIPDLVSHYRTRDTGVDVSDIDACVTGELLDGRLIKGCDDIVVE